MDPLRAPALFASSSRLHDALMPDYNAKATAYWWGVVLLGAAALMQSAVDVWTESPAAWVQIFGGVSVAMLAGAFPVRIPKSKNSFAAGEIFIFLLLLMHGPAAATLAAAGESMVASVRMSKRWTSRIASPMMAALAMFVAGPLLQAMLDAMQKHQLTDPSLVVVAAMLFSPAYFALNTLLITALPHLKRNERFRLADFVGIFGWVGFAITGSAAVAALLYLNFRQSGIGVVVAVVPILGMLLAMVHSFNRQIETRQKISEAEARAAEREAAVALRHLEELQLSERRYHELAFHDALTGLPNRRSFGDHLGRAIERAQSDPGQVYAVMFLDFDRFKLINDSLGHNAGDEFLKQAAHRIQQHVRPQDTVARLGGDEFAVLAQGIERESDVTRLADRVIAGLGEPFLVAGTELNSSASIGITTGAFGYLRLEDVLRDADIAMYKAKAAGKARYALFDAGMHVEAAQRLSLEGDLRRAIATGQLGVAYQPIHEMSDGRIIGFEALARWSHPEHGDVEPGRFVAMAEECGVMPDLTDLVLHRACDRLAAWQRLDPVFAGLTMHVNLSGKDIALGGLVARVTRAIAAAGLAPDSLALELTENILMERLGAALPVLRELREMGIGLSVDDFGTGYSSLAHLSSLPIDSLKIDRSFVDGMKNGSSEAAVVQAVVHLGRSLGKRVIAEGIETRAQFEQLRTMGCGAGQGFHLAMPLGAARCRCGARLAAADTRQRPTRCRGAKTLAGHRPGAAGRVGVGQVAGLSLSAFRFSTSSLLIGAFRLMPLGGIGDMNHLV